VEKEVLRELTRFERIPEVAAEYSALRTYLDWMVELPWSISSEEQIDLPKAREILDTDHYDLEKVKKRILEFLAVRKLRPDGKSPILCFVGPPGVGKTSLGQSIARAMNRKFVRQSLGGVHDEAESGTGARMWARCPAILSGNSKAGTRIGLYVG
jgi:ATP-dependent Lon protease